MNINKMIQFYIKYSCANKILGSNLDAYVNLVSYADAWAHVNYNVFFFVTIGV